MSALFYCFSSLRINFADDNKLDLSNSETLKLVHELDNTKEAVEPGLFSLLYFSSKS